MHSSSSSYSEASFHRSLTEMSAAQRHGQRRGGHGDEHEGHDPSAAQNLLFSDPRGAVSIPCARAHDSAEDDEEESKSRGTSSQPKRKGGGGGGSSSRARDRRPKNDGAQKDKEGAGAGTTRASRQLLRSQSMSERALPRHSTKDKGMRGGKGSKGGGRREAGALEGFARKMRHEVKGSLERHDQAKPAAGQARYRQDQDQDQDTARTGHSKQKGKSSTKSSGRGGSLRGQRVGGEEEAARATRGQR